MLVSAQPVAPSTGIVLAMGLPWRTRMLTMNGQLEEATTPSFVKSSIWMKGSCQ